MAPAGEKNVQRFSETSPSKDATRMSARKVMRRFSRTTIEMLADACDRGCSKRNSSLRILLGMLYSHAIQICTLPVTIQESILRRAVAQLVGRPDLPLPSLLILLTIWGQWRVTAAAMKRERRLFSSFDKKSAKENAEYCFSMWAGSFASRKEKQRACQKLMMVLSDANGKQLLQFTFEEWKHIVINSKAKTQQQRKFMSLMSNGSNDVLLRNSISGWTSLIQVTKADAAKQRQKQVQIGKVMSVIDQDNQAVLQGTCFRVWLKQTEQQKLENQRMKEKAEVVARTLELRSSSINALFMQSAQFLLAECYRQWQVGAKHVKEQLEHAAQLMAVMGSGQAHLLTSTCLREWTKSVAADKEARVRLHTLMVTFVNESHALLECSLKAWHSHAAEVVNSLAKAKKYLLNLTTSQGNSLLSSALGSWRMIATRELRSKRAEEQRVVQQGSVMKTLNMMCAEQDSAMTGTTFHSWVRLTLSEKATRERKNKESQYLGKSLQMIMDGDTQFLKSNAFRALVMNLMREQQEKRLQAANAAKNLEREAKRKAMTVMFDSNFELLKGSLFVGWSRLVSEEQEKKAKANKLMKWMASEDSTGLLRVTFKAWLDESTRNRYSCRGKESTSRIMGLVSEGHDQLELAKAYNAWIKLVEVKKGKIESNKRLLANIMQRDSSGSLRFFLSEWSKVLEVIRQERRRGSQRARNLDSQTNAVQRVLNASLGGILHVWRQVIIDSRADELHRKQTETLGMMMGGQDGPVLLTRIFNAWLEVLKDHKQEEQFEKYLREREVAEEQKDRVGGKILQDATTNMLMGIFLHWAYGARSFKLERVSSKLAFRNQQMPLLVNELLTRLVDRNTVAVTLRYLHAWRWQTATPKTQSRSMVQKTHAAMSASSLAGPLRASLSAWSAHTREVRQTVNATDRYARVARASVVRWLAADTVMTLSASMRTWQQETTRSFKSVGSEGARRLSQEAQTRAEEAERMKAEAERIKDRLSKARQSAVMRVGSALSKGVAKGALSSSFAGWRRLMAESSAVRRTQRDGACQRAAGALASKSAQGCLRSAWMAWSAAIRPGEDSTSACPRAVYFFGGFGPQSPAGVERFDPESDSWEPLPRMPTPRCAAAAACLGERIYVVGGFCGREYLGTVDRFDPRSRRWDSAQEMLERRGYVAGAATGDTMFAIGGYNGMVRLNSAEAFDLKSRSWSRLPPMTSQRNGAAAAAVTEAGRVLVFVAGGDDGGGPLSSTEALDPVAGWRQLPPMRHKRSGAAAAIVRQLMLVIGGSDGQPLSSVEIFDVDAGDWAELGASMKVPRDALGAVTFGNSVFVFGGHDGKLRQRTIEVYDPGRGCWDEHHQRSHGRNFAAVAIGPR